MSTSYQDTNKMITGIVFGVITFWLFVQSMVNVVPAIQEDLGISLGLLNIAISLTALFSGIFVVAAGGLADKFGRKKMTYFWLLLSIIGSLCLVFANGAALLIIGRIIQGLSAACIMPATIALMRTYFEGAERQRALSYWSIGSWGGSGVCSFAGGAIATYMGWRWIFVFSIVFALLAMVLLKGTPENKVKQQGSSRFDFTGLVVFVFTMIGLNVVITRGADFGLTSPLTIVLIVATVIGILFFIKIGYLASVLVMIRAGEKMLQNIGARLPMIVGFILTAIGIGTMALTFLPDTAYIIVVFVGFILFGTGLGMYATPSTDTAVSSAPEDKVGSASGIYKMASVLGGSFGVAISAAIYGTMTPSGNIEQAASAGIIANVVFAVLALVAIMILIPKATNEPVAQKTVVNKGFTDPVNDSARI